MPQRDELPGADSETVGATITADADAATIMGEGLATSRQQVDVGDVLGGFEIVRRLGAGGMGEVFAARGREGGPLVALKVLSEVHATRLYRFKREFRALADVRHDNLIALDELVVLPNGQAFFTMELVDGVPFVEYVRGDTPKGQLPNLVRLERALRQLIAGIHHLHLARCVHRDLKPSNVLVTREGRVVILDFGLVSEMAQSEEQGLTRDGQMMGTPAYMAPEQAGGQAAGPAADYYAAGIMLFESLTGTLPFSGAVLDILIQKRHGEVPDPRARLDGSVTTSASVDSLIELCMQALAPEPEDRPAHEQFLEALGGAAPQVARSSAASPAVSRSAPVELFVGRERELAVLEDAFASVAGSINPVAVHIRGASGQGKSALVGRFLDKIRRDQEIVLLRGRCLERESVPYKGIDAVVDALSIYLRRLDAVEAASLQPRHLAPLLQLFPVLGDAWPGTGRAMDLEAGELRRRGLAGLREVLARVGARRPLVVYVDDFQWADVDSARLITELMRPPDPPAMLLIVTFRDEVDERETLQLLTAEDAVHNQDVREIEIGPLSEADARKLAVALLREREAEDPQAEGVESSAEVYARRAQGNPFYIGQMVLGADAHSSTDASLDRLVARRIVALEPAQQELLSAVAVAGGPTPVSVALTAAGAATVAPNNPEIDVLLAANLLRRHEDGRLETAHDRIRVVAVGELSPAQLRRYHLALGEAFEQLGGGESEALAEHFALGGDNERALDYTEQAASDAAAALAFERAAELYRRALELIAEREPERRRELELALADQLVDMGRGAEAAELLSKLAETAPKPEDARELRRRAASELVKAGYLDEGMDTISPVLREIGVWQPRGPVTAILGTIWNRVIMLIRGYDFEQHQESEVPPRLLERIDSLLATKTGLTHHEAIFAGYQQSRAIRLALRAGEARRLIRCLVHDAAIWVAMGRKQRGEQLMAKARELVKGVAEPEYHRVVEYVTANHLDHSGHWVEAAAGFEKLHERLDESPNSSWIRGASTVQWMYVRKLLGRFELLRNELPERVATARDLGIRHEHISLSNLWAHTQAIYGEFDSARRLHREIREQWHPRQVTFQHIIIAVTEFEIAMLAGEVEEAIAAAERVLDDTKARIVASMMPSHVDFYELRARSRVRAAIEGVDPERSMKLVGRDLERMRKSHKPQVAPQAMAIEAALDSCKGDTQAALAHWREAAAQFEELAMSAHLAAVNARLGDHGDDAAKRKADEYFEAQAIPEPRRLVDTLAPGRPA